MTKPADKARKQLILLQFNTQMPADLGTLLAYRPEKKAARLTTEVTQRYKKKFGDSKKNVQPPFRALEAVLRAVTGDWARFNLHGDTVELLAGGAITPEDRFDVFTCWAETILADDEDRHIARALAEMIAAAEPSEDVPIPDPTGSRRSASWWPGELSRWRLAQDLAAKPWKLGGKKKVTFTLCSNGTLAALGHEIPGEPDRKGRVRYLLPRILIGTGATGHDPQPAVTVNAVTSLLAKNWYGVRTVILANPDQPLAVAARTDGPPWDVRLNVPAVAASRRLAALPRLSRLVPPLPEHLDDALLQDPASSTGPWAIAPVADKYAPLGRGSGMEMFRRIQQQIENHCQTYADRMPVYVEATGVSMPVTEGASHTHGPITVEYLPAALDAAGIDTLLVAVLWSTNQVRSRIQAEIAKQWGLGERFVARDRQLYDALADRIKIVFLKDRAGALNHSADTVERRKTLLREQLADFLTPGVAIAALCETDWDPDKSYSKTAERLAAEAVDGKFLSQQALAQLNVSTQYVNHDPPPVRTANDKGEPYSEKYIARQTKTRDSKLSNSTEMAVRDMLRGLGVIDHRLGAAFGHLPMKPWWHIGVHVRRHSPRRIPGQKRPGGKDEPALMTVTLAAIRPTGDNEAPWTAWAYCMTSRRWLPYRTARLTLHAGDLGLDVSKQATIGDESQHAAAAAQIVEAALRSATNQLPLPGPAVVYVDGDATESIWNGLADENIGQAPPDDLPRAASWLPGYGLPRAQRPLAVVRVINDIGRIGRPVGARIFPGGEAHQTKTTTSLFQRRLDGVPGLLPDFLLCNVPRIWASGAQGRFADVETRYAPSAADRQNKNAYAHTAIRYTVIALDDDADTDLIGKGAAVLTNQAVSWDGRLKEPVPLRMARQLDMNHPYHRRTVPSETDDGAPDNPADTTEPSKRPVTIS